MKIVELDYANLYKKLDFPNMVIALGNFDGVHRGHQEVLNCAKKLAAKNNLAFSIMIFNPHPSIVLDSNRQNNRLLLPLDDRIERLRETGANYLFKVNFSDKFAQVEAVDFVEKYLIGLNAKHIVVGFDYRYGRFGAGNINTLQIHSKGNFEISVISSVTDASEKISSTRIRHALDAGNCDEANRLLGYVYHTSGTVIHGDARARQLGFPTANLKVADGVFFPKIGVYAIKVKIDDKYFEGVGNLGYKPTFYQEKSSSPLIEAHILNFSCNIYGKKIIVEWHKFLRFEKKFASVNDLIKQINEDKKKALEFFATKTN